MTSQLLSEINTAMKSLSMRRENLYRALAVHPPGSKPWQSNRHEIDSINESMSMFEEQRQSILDDMEPAVA